MLLLSHLRTVTTLSVEWWEVGLCVFWCCPPCVWVVKDSLKPEAFTCNSLVPRKGVRSCPGDAGWAGFHITAGCWLLLDSWLPLSCCLELIPCPVSVAGHGSGSQSRRIWTLPRGNLDAAADSPDWALGPPPPAWSPWSTGLGGAA